jgi:hypothetical protein
VLLDLGGGPGVLTHRRRTRLSHRSRTWLTVARVGGLRFSSTLGQAAGSGSLRLAVSLGAGRDGPSQVVSRLRHGIGPGVELHAE